MKLIENIRVGNTIDGLGSIPKNGKCCRGYIKPLPPTLVNRGKRGNYGIYLDALFNDAWLEGMLLDDHEHFEERAMFFFSDEGDEQKFHVRQFREMQD